MKKFFVLYLAPVSVLEEWAKTEQGKRQEAEEKMRSEWDLWMKDHANMIIETAGLGKTKRITASGIEDTRNDLMLYSMVEAESYEEVAKTFEKHPHLEIPQASIEIMEASVLPEAR